MVFYIHLFVLSFNQLLNFKTTYSEQELVTLLQQRNNTAFSYLYDNYSGALNGIINQIVPEPETAKDVLQEVFVSIWRKIESYDPVKGRLFTWMLNIARNASIDKIRSRNYRNNLKNQTLAENVNDPLNIQVVKPVYDNIGLRRIVSQLKEEQRILIELSYFQGFTHEEIAKVMNIPLGTVKTRIRTALIQLRTML